MDLQVVVVLGPLNLCFIGADHARNVEKLISIRFIKQVSRVE